VHAVRIRDLRIASTWFGTTFTTGIDFDGALDAFKRQIEFLKAVDAKDVVVAELANAVNQVRAKSVLTDRPILSEPQWYLLTASLDVAGRFARESGMQLSYHPNVGTGVQTIKETDRLLGSTHPDYVALCLDTAHLRFGGASQSDLEQLTKTHIKRIKHVHLKNVRKDVLPVAVSNKYSFYQAIQAGIFTVPGDPAGDLNLEPILEALQSIGYDRWLVVEAEQNPLHEGANPLKCAHTARDYIKSQLGY
jgi:inosose dehydratase